MIPIRILDPVRSIGSLGRILSVVEPDVEVYEAGSEPGSFDDDQDPIAEESLEDPPWIPVGSLGSSLLWNRM